MSFQAPQTHGLPVSTVIIQRIRKESPLLVLIWKVTHIITFACCLFASWYLVNKTKDMKYWGIAGGSLVSLALWWPVYEFASDVYRCRRLLDEIAKK